VRVRVCVREKASACVCVFESACANVSMSVGEEGEREKEGG